MLFLVIVALSTLTVLLFNGTLRESVPLTLVSDRAGLVMENGAKVKLRGVQVGEVASIGAETAAGTDLSKLRLKMDPGPFQYLPSNVEAEIKSSTAFGAKYVDLIVPQEGASSEPLKPGAVLHSRNVTVEVNTVFENLQSVVHSIDPAKLNSVLSAIAESVRGKGERIGQAITDANNVLLTVNPRMPTVRQDWQLFGKTAEAYSDAAQDILSILDSFSTTSTTITTHAKSLDALLLSAVGFSQSGINTIGGNQSNLVRAINILDPTTALFMKYSPTYTCLFQGAQWFLDHGGRDALGGNGKSVIMDAGLLMGDDPYRYPGQPADRQRQGRPRRQAELRLASRCQQELPGEVPGHRHRVRHWPRYPAQSRHRLPWHSPTTSLSPRRIRNRRGSGTPAALRPGPYPAYPGAPPYGAPEYGPDGTPLYPPPPPGAPPPRAGGTAMRRRTIRAAIRVALFTVLCLVSMFVLVTVFGQFRFDSRASYSAVFTNVSGLKGGNFVRIAGVEVGKVKDLTLHKDGTVTVDFAIDKGLTLTEGTKAAVRYENLIGDRYLSLEEGPGSVRKLQPGQTIPLARTSPALDVDALIGGFRPLFRALDPDQVNALSGQLLKVFQGQGGTISSVLAQTSALTTTLAGRDQLIGQSSPT